jgi:hypothetical protein
MVQGHEGPSFEENTLFWAERTICAMRAARDTSHRAWARRDSERGGSHRDHPDPSTVAVPDACWLAIVDPLVTLAHHAQLHVTVGRRYMDSPGVVYVSFSRRKD